MKIAVIGAGAWGTALAVQASARHEVLLWAKRPEHALSMNKERMNTAYLKGISFGDKLSISSEPLGSWLSTFDVVVLAAPMAGLRELLIKCASLQVSCPTVWLCKGFESSGQLAHEVQHEVAPFLNAGVLSGPSFAMEVALLQPTALVAASPSAQVRNSLVQAFHTESLRVYSSDDWIGVEVGGAVKNVLAIATGLCDGLKLGLNARAALVTRGLAEMTTLGVALGAKAQTFMGLSGLGDLVLTSTGDLSRNRKVGLNLAQGMGLKEVLASLGHVAEGVYSAHTVLGRAQRLGVEMPITSAVVSLLQGKVSASQAVSLLMSRSARDEF
jgi:glycerol-3-phosphate dehydrogenase (NAD(P)+)